MSSESPWVGRRLWTDLGMARVEGGGGIDPALPGMALGWVEAAILEAWHYEEAVVVKLMSEWREDAGMKSRRQARTAHRGVSEC